MKNYLIKLLSIISLTILGTTILYAATWSGALVNPPTGNVNAPINLSVTDQTKQGDVCTRKKQPTGAVKCLSGAKMRLPKITSFTVSATTVSNGGTATLSWTTTEADTCTASNSWSGAKASSGSGVSTGSLSGAQPNGTTYTFTLTCSGRLGDSLPSSVSVYAYPAPTAPVGVTVYSDNQTVYVGESTTLRWSSSKADQCYGASPNSPTTWYGGRSPVGTSGNAPTGIFLYPSNYYYYMDCSNAYGTTYGVAFPYIISVVDKPIPTLTFTADKTTAISGTPASGTPDYVTLNWSSTNFTSCVTSGWDSTYDAQYSGVYSVGPPLGIYTSGSVRMLSSTPQNLTYSITCTGIGGSVTKTIDVKWQQLIEKTVVFPSEDFIVPTNVTSLEVEAGGASGGGGGGGLGNQAPGVNGGKGGDSFVGTSLLVSSSFVKATGGIGGVGSGCYGNVGPSAGGTGNGSLSVVVGGAGNLGGTGGTSFCPQGPVVNGIGGTGGAGGYTKGNILVTPGALLKLVVGKAGTAGSGNNQNGKVGQNGWLIIRYYR